MSLVSDFYPGDGVIGGIALVVLAISITTALALLIARRFARRPTVRHAILASALLSSLATPLIALAIRTSGTSTLAWNLLPAEPSRTLQPEAAGLKPSVAQRLASFLAHDEGAESAPQRVEPAAAASDIASEPARPPAPAKQIEIASPTHPPARAAGGRGAIRDGLSLALVVWLCGVGVLLARLACASVGVFRIRRSCQPFCTGSRENTTARLLRSLPGSERVAAILVSDKIPSPVATGLFRGAVILPAGLVTKITPNQLSDVLIHECAHIVRRDPLMLYLQVAAGSIFWPIPWVHRLNRELGSACEEICDNYVLAQRNPLQYAETLLRVATLAGRTRREPVLVGMLNWHGKLESRIASLIDGNRSKATRSERSWAGLCLGALLLASAAICGITIRPARSDAAPPSSATEAADTVAAGAVDAAVVAAPGNASPPQAQTAPAEGDAKAADKAAEPTQIQIWWPMGGVFGQAFQKQVRQFNESQQQVVVDVRIFGGYGDVQRALNTAFQSGGLPDAAIIEIHNIAAFAADDRIQPLDALAASDPTFQADDLLPGVLTNLRYRDKLYAIPMNRSLPILYFNRDRFAAAGLDPNKPPTTWQQLREMAQRLTSDNRQQYGFLAGNSAWFFESLVWSNGGELVVDGKPTFAEFGAGPLQLWADMVHLDMTARFGTNGIAEFSSGRAAMVIDSTAQLPTYLSQSGFKVGTAVLPHSEDFQNAVPTGGGAAVIPATISAERRAAVWAFATWFISTRQTTEWSRTTGYVPVRESGHAALKAEGFYDAHPEFEVAIQQMAFAREAPQLPQWGAAWKIISDAMTSVVRDDGPSLRTLKDAEIKVEALLDSKPAAQR